MYIVYYSVYCDYFDVLTGHCVSELGHLSSYRNVWLFYKNYIVYRSVYIFV